jgi:hypothetical protein
VALVVDCRDPTEITIVVHPHELCAPGKPELRVSFTSGAPGQGETAAPNAVAVGCPADGSYSLVYVPQTAKDASIDVKVLAARGKDPSACDVAKHDSDCIWQRRRVSFVPHEPLTVTIDLASACLGIPCSEDTTCNPSNGECIAKDAPVPSCAGDTCAPIGDAGNASDAPSAADTGEGLHLDAQVDAGPAYDGSAGDAAEDAPQEDDSGLLRTSPSASIIRCPGTTGCALGTQQCVLTPAGAGICASSGGMPAGRSFLCDGDEDCPTSYECCYNTGSSHAQCGSACGSLGTILCSGEAVNECPGALHCQVSPLLGLPYGQCL